MQAVHTKGVTLRLSVRPLRTVAPAHPVELTAYTRCLDTVEMHCAQGNVHVNEKAVDTHSSSLPPGVHATSGEVVVSVPTPDHSKVKQTGRPTAAVHHLPVLACQVAAGEPVSSATGVRACSTRTSKRVVVPEGEARDHPTSSSSSLGAPVKTIRFVDLTALTAQDNVLLRSVSSGELLPPFSLLCVAKKAPPTRRPVAPLLMKRRRIVVLQEDTEVAGAASTYELVSFALKRRVVDG